MHCHTTAFISELGRRGLPTSLTSAGNVKPGEVIPNLPFVQLMDPLDEARLSELASCPGIVRLSLARGSRLPLRELAVLPALRVLRVSSTPEGSHPGYADLEQLPELEALELSGLGHAVSDLAAVARSKLAVLELSDALGAELMAEAFAALAEAPELEALMISSERGPLAPEALIPLSSLPKLRKLDLSRCAWLKAEHLGLLPDFAQLEGLALGNGDPGLKILEDPAFAKLLAKLDALRELDLVNFRDAGSKSLAAVSAMPLRRLDVGTTWTGDRKMSDKAVASLAAMEQLEHLGLHACARLGDPGFEPLTAITTLSSFVLTDKHRVTTPVLERFIGAQAALRELSVAAPLGDEALASVASQLRVLRVGDSSKLGPAAYQAIAAMSEAREVELWGCTAGSAELELLSASPSAGAMKLFYNYDAPIDPDLRAAHPGLAIY